MSEETPVPQVHVSEVRRLVAILRHEGQWMTAREIAAAFGGKAPCDRKVRRIASVAAPVVVSFPGSPGYRYFGACSEEEIEHCVNALSAQSTDMMKRANLYRHALNKRRMRILSVPEQNEFSLSP